MSTFQEEKTSQANIDLIVGETYRKIFSEELTNVIIEVLRKERYTKMFKERTGEEPLKNSSGTVYRRKEDGMYFISVIKEEDICETIVQIGHEIGHAIGPISRRSIESKDSDNYFLILLGEIEGYSLQNLWSNIIERHNIGNLGDRISKANQKLLRFPLENKSIAGTNYYAALLVGLFEKNKPGKLFNFLNSKPYCNKVIYTIAKNLPAKYVPIGKPST